MYQSRRKRPLISYNIKDDHYNHFNCGWVFLILIILGLFITWFIAASSTPTPEFAREGNSKRSDCTLGETYDDVSQMCAPNSRFPIQVDTTIIDEDTPACESFFRHSCGKWNDAHENADRSFSFVHQENQREVAQIVKNAPQGSPIHALYTSCVDTIVRSKHIKETQMERNHMMRTILDDFVSMDDLAVTFGRLTRAGYTAPFSLSIELHPMKNYVVPLIVWDGFEDVNDDILSILFSQTSHSFEKLVAFKEIQQKLISQRKENEKDITSFVEYLDVGGRFEHHLTTLSRLSNSRWDWNEYFEEIDGTAFNFDLTQEVWCMNIAYMGWLLENAKTEFTLLHWRSFVEFSILYHTHDYMPELPSNDYFRERNTIKMNHILKRNHNRFDDSDCVRLTQHMLPGLVSEKFMSDVFPHTEETRYKVQKMGEHIRDTLAEMVSNTEWIDAVSRLNIVAKLRAIIVRAVHPNIWNPEPFAHRLVPDRYLHNLNIIRRHRIRQNLILWKKEGVNRDEVQRFGAPLTTVNAFYSPVTNTITIFAGILRKPFYDEKANMASLYASIGTVIGHEFSHALDSSGIRFDFQGSFRRTGDTYWVKPETLERFNEKLQCVVDEYSAMDLNVDCASKPQSYGRQTLGENIADIVGVRAAYLTFLKMAPPDEITTDAKQWFWATFAQMWCESYDQKHLCNQVNNDVHSVSLFRVDKTLRNIAEFRKDYHCDPTRDRMAKENNEMCTVYG